MAGGSDFASVLKRLRRARGWSQETLAERAAISAQAVTALECGLRKSPYPKTIALLANALELDEAGRGELEAAAAANRAARHAAADALEARSGALPPPLTAVIGRERELGELDALLRAERLVTVAGPGGIGKTTLALEAARRAQQRYDGAVFCDLSALRDGAHVAGAIASACGAIVRDDRDPVGALAAALHAASLLLVLDNCEHLVGDVAKVAARLLRTAPEVRIIATSRRRLGVATEVVYRVPSLDADAVTLFAQRAAAVNPDFALTEANTADVTRICRRLDGIALAIELAAAQVRLMSVAELERRLGQRFRLLREAARDDQPRRRTLAAAFDWSYGLLSAREQRFFRALGIFAGSFPLEAALEICCEDGADELQALELLGALVDASLVVADVSGEATRYRLLETTRAYAADALAREDETATLAARHLGYYRNHGIELDFERELEDVRAALRWALDGGDAAAGADLLTRIGARWSLLGLAPEGIARLETFLPSIPESDAATLASARITLAMLRGESLRYAHALDEARAAVALARRTNDDVLLFQASRAVATFANLVGEYDEADDAIREAREALGRRPAEVRTSILLYTESLISRRRGLLEQALDALRGAYRIACALRHLYLQVQLGANIADVEHEAGRTAEALAVVEGLRADAEIWSYRDGAVLANVAGYHLALGQDAEALAAARELFALRNVRPGMRVYVTVAFEHAALARARHGDAGRAARLLGYCDASYRETGYERQHTERRTHEELLARLQHALSAAEFARLTAEGAAFGVDRAMQEALADAPIADDTTTKETVT